MALAYLITFTTYGTWLHGNPRGSADSEHRTFGEPYAEVDAARVRRMRESMKQPAYVLNDTARNIVCEAIVSLAEKRNWKLKALHVLPTHLHAVVWTTEKIRNE